MSLPRQPIHWRNTIFLLGTLFLSLTAVPAYLWYFGLDWFQVGMFTFYFFATGLSVTLGYHRLFAHRAFKAAWPVRLFTLAFGAAAFQNSALIWVADHRKHHKFVDDEKEDPYSISKGFFHAHIGWLLFQYEEEPPLSYVEDLKQDRMIQWQHRFYVPIAVAVGFLLPAGIGALWGGWQGALGGLLLAGLARLVFVQHMTFFINSFAHTVGRQPYSARNSARDSGIMALFTFGEGYHNFHHAFQHDYRNGVKPWQYDPTKWMIWLLQKVGLADQLRRVPKERILLAEMTEQQRRLAEKLDSGTLSLAESVQARLQAAHQRLQLAAQQWENLESEYTRAVERKLESSKDKLAELRRQFNGARERLRLAIRECQESHRLALASCA